jgi:hypothetical protein
MGELMFARQGGKGLSIASSHPLTADRVARMNREHCSGRRWHTKCRPISRGD